MNKRIITVIAIAGLVAAGLGIYLFISQSNKSNENDKGQAYIEPNPNFFDASQISANDTVIKITDDGFSPSSITVKKGTKVTFANFTNNYAWPASDPHP